MYEGCYLYFWPWQHDKAPSYSTVKNWYNEFNRGRCSIQDESRAGRPKSVVVPEKINAVRELIKQDRHVTYREIEASLDISMTSINKILHEHLSVKKICSRWIPHNLTNVQKKARVDWCKEMLEKYIQGTSKAVYNIYTGDESWIYAYEPETKQQSTVWVFQDEAKPTKVVRGRSTSKQMIACFFSINGHVATVALEQSRTVNSERRFPRIHNSSVIICRNLANTVIWNVESSKFGYCVPTPSGLCGIANMNCALKIVEE
ncbi:HTH_48 domain-containing protein [Nephila pilipes]|uniref:HTH_48 domain-containing protein n=1 Tax=Nephila pilipes TaxID=299642 RepID=A0A8X6P0R2_NEPPI|nr:HTH_48 domain-containing protein [Nephila pilipes]